MKSITTNKDHNAFLTSQINNLSDLLDSQNQDKTKLEQSMLSLQDLTLQILSDDSLKIEEILPNEMFRSFLDKVGAWIIKNFSSSKLSLLISTLCKIFELKGHKAEVTKEEITKLFRIETVDDLINNKKDKDNIAKSEEPLYEDSQLTNQFLSSLYALIVTISNKPEIIIKSKNLLKTLTSLLTQLCLIDNLVSYYKKRRLISLFMTILNVLRKDPTTKESLITMSKLTMSLFSKIGMTRQIYRDYMFKKGVPDRVADLFLLHYKEDDELIKIFAVYCYFSVRTNDHKTFYWSKGICSVFLDILSDEKDIECVEYVTLALYNLTIDNIEIQSELIDLDFLKVVKHLLTKHSENKFIIHNLICTMRRFKNEEYNNNIAKDLLLTFFALFDFYYFSAKQRNSIGSYSFDLLILKELIALLGNIVKDERHCIPFTEKNFHLVLIDIILSFVSYPKLVKNTIGALINLTNSNEVRENITQVAAFIQSIYLIMDQYKENLPIIDYTLKMIANIIKDEVSIRIFISGDMFYYLLMYLRYFSNLDSSEDLIVNCIKILRALIVNKKGFMDFLDKLEEFYSLFDENESHERSHYHRIFIDELISLITKKFHLHISEEIILFLSILSNNDEMLQNILEDNKNFHLALQKLIGLYSDDPSSSKIISQCIAQLPIEEFDHNK